MAKVPEGFVEEIARSVRESGTVLGHVERILDATRKGHGVASAIANAERDFARLPVAEPAETTWATKIDPAKVTHVETVRTDTGVLPGARPSRG